MESGLNIKESKKIENSISSLISLSLYFNQINKALESKLNLSIVQWSVLKTLLEMPAISPLHLSKALGVTPGTLSQTLSRLEKKNFLFMRYDPNDARKKMISITRNGKRALDISDAQFKQFFSEINRLEKEIKLVASYLYKKVAIELEERPPLPKQKTSRFIQDGLI
jgi:DNA-binding MarR family transcriptional regulator